MIYIFWTCRDKAEAKRIIQGLLERHLIACGSIFPEVESLYRWEGKIEEGKEVKVMLKTVASHFEKIRSVIQEECSYKVPEIAQVDVALASPAYLSWVMSETKS